MVLSIAHDPEDNHGKSMAWIVLDSIIVACIAFISTLPSTHLPSLLDLYTSLKAFAYAFFIQLAVERGIKPYLKRRNSGKGG